MATLTWDLVADDNAITDGGGDWDTTSNNWTSDDGATNTTFTNGDSVIIGALSSEIIIDGDIEVADFDLMTRNTSFTTFRGGQLTITGNADLSSSSYNTFDMDVVLTETSSVTFGSMTLDGDFTSEVVVSIASNSYTTFNEEVNADFVLSTDSSLYLNGEFFGTIDGLGSSGNVTIGTSGTASTTIFGIDTSVNGVLIGTGGAAFYGAKDGSNFYLYEGIVIGDIKFDGDEDRFSGAGGTVFGKIDMGNGNDIFEVFGGSSSGFIEADKIILGEGDDILKLGTRDVDVGMITAGEGDDVVRINKAFSDLEIKGGDGDDKIITGFGDDSVDGGADNDRLLLGLGDDVATGGSGDDVIRGSIGDDSLFGGDGDDIVLGQGGKDVLYGGTNSDEVRGGGGADSLFGDNGADTLTGGGGSDVLEGGAGADIFSFTNARQTKVGKADVITDFEQGVDKIDVSAIDSTVMGVPLGAKNGAEALPIDFLFNDEFVFGEVGDFTFGLGLLSSEIVDGNTIISGDIENDGSIEFEIILEGEIELSRSDFIGVTDIVDA